MNEADTIRRNLITVAKDYAETLKLRPNVVGLVLYGSLARGGLTQFSDVDIVTIYDGKLPDYWAEHRIVNGVKVDVIFDKLKAMKDLIVRLPYNLFEGYEVSYYFLESLLLGGMDTILFDPTGEIARVKQELNWMTCYQKLVIPAASEQFHHIVKGGLSSAEELMQKGDFKGAIEQTKWAAYGFSWTMGSLTTLKDLKAASEKLNIPEFYPIVSQLKQIVSPEKEAVKAVWQSCQALWGYSLKAAYEPIKEKLTNAGVKDPEKLELIGDYQLFWGGYRLHELGRVIAEVNLSLKWSSFELDLGNVSEALDILWGCHDSNTIRERWKRIGAAIKDSGYDISEIVEQLLDNAEFKRLAEQFDEANKRLQISSASSSEAEMAIALAQKLQALLAKAFPLMPLLKAYTHNASCAHTSVRLAHALSRLEETYIERDELDKFIRFCDERKRATGGQSELKSLKCWYLQAEDIEEPLSSLKIMGKGAAWQWRDPEGNSSYEFLSEGDIEIRMTAPCDLHGNRLTAPALLLEFSGDFTVETTVIGTGGILVWKDEKHYLYLQRHRYMEDEVRFEATLEEDGEAIPFVIGRGKLKAEKLYIRMNRSRSKFSAWCSKDATEWFGCGEIAVEMNDPIFVGVFGVSLRRSSEPMKTKFGALKVWLNTQV